MYCHSWEKIDVDHAWEFNNKLQGPVIQRPMSANLRLNFNPGYWKAFSKLNERAARVRFEITSMISDQTCLTRSSITTLSHPFYLQFDL